MRTWFICPASSAPCDEGVPRTNSSGGSDHAKKRVPVPGVPGHRTRSPKDGLPRMLKRAPAGRRAP